MEIKDFAWHRGVSPLEVDICGYYHEMADQNKFEDNLEGLHTTCLS